MQGTRVRHSLPYCLLCTNIKTVHMSVLQPNSHRLSAGWLCCCCIILQPHVANFMDLQKDITKVLHRSVQLVLVPTTRIRLADHNNQVRSTTDKSHKTDLTNTKLLRRIITATLSLQDITD